MNILYIHQHFCTPEGGSGIRSYMFSRLFIEHGHSVRMLCGATHMSEHPRLPRRRVLARSNIEGIDVVRIGVPYTNFMGYSVRILSFIAFTFLSVIAGVFSKGVDVVYATSTPLTIGLAGYLIAWLKHVPFIFEVRDLWPEAAVQIGALRNRFVIRLARCLEAFLYRKAARIITLSPGMSEGVLQTGVSPRKVQMIPNGCDLEMFKPWPPEPLLLERWSLRDRFVVAYVGAIGRSNDLGFLLEAAKILAEIDRSVAFLIVGEGSDLAALCRRARDEGLSNVVFTGKLPHREIPRVYAASSVTTTFFRDLPILTTNSPNKLFDSLAAGRPVIVNSDGWTRQLLEETHAGIYVPPDKPDVLAEVLLSLKQHPIRLGAMGRAARRLAEERFDRKRLAQEALEILEEVADVRYAKVA